MSCSFIFAPRKAPSRLIQVNELDTDKMIDERRSIRKFDEAQLWHSDIKKIITAGLKAPSYCNTRGWKFLILTKEEKDKIVENGGADFIATSPLAVMVFYPKSVNPYHDDVQSASACIENMLLMAASLGIGSCWVCHLPTQRYLKKLLKVPGHYRVIACVVFGHKTGKMMPQKREISEVEYNKHFIFEKKRFNLRDFMKYLYIRQPIRLKFIEQKFTKRF